MQVATAESVYLLDFVALEAELCEKDWYSFFQNLFTNQTIRNLGRVTLFGYILNS